METINKADDIAPPTRLPSPARKQAESAVLDLYADPDPAHPNIDGSGSSFLIISLGSGENAACAKAWLAEAAALGPVQWLTFSDYNPETRRQLFRSLSSSLNGVRIMIVGRQFDVLQTIALARSAGALEKEVLSHITSTDDLAIFCAHCRATNRVVGAAGDVVTCPTCVRKVEIHAHLSGVRGSYLASDALARELP